ncbi:MAG: universal stress protein [Bacteroidetes bacterium]|nr:universal stress protein [Fibrella sp.]
MKTIIVPTDLSPLADGALRVATDLARTYGAAILLVHYLPFSIATATTAEGAQTITRYLDEQEATAQSDLQRVVDNPAYQDIAITPITCRDAAGLYKAMTERGADLIVLATSGSSGWDEWLFGSNAEHIVRAAHCPVLVIKQTDGPFAPTNPIAAIDVDDALRQHWPPYPFGMTGNGLTQFVYVSTPGDTLVPEGVHAWMDELAQERGITGYELHIRPARSVESGILNYAIERRADLIVVFTHGHTGLRHLLQGSVAEDVLNHASVPVLIMRIEDTHEPVTAHARENNRLSH